MYLLVSVDSNRSPTQVKELIVDVHALRVLGLPSWKGVLAFVPVIVDADEALVIEVGEITVNVGVELWVNDWIGSESRMGVCLDDS